MTKRDIRLEYSGFVIFAAKMLSVVTGLIFQFLVARSLSIVSVGNKTEYDYWFNLNDVMAYFTLMSGVLPFWVMRFATREKKGAIKTGIVANLGISTAATLIYLLLLPLIISALNVDVNYFFIYLLISIQIMELYSVTALEACLQSRIPQTIGYGLLIQQVCRVIIGYVLIVEFHQYLLGAVVTTIAAFALQIVYYLRLLAQELKQKIEWKYVKEWFKGSLISIYNVVGNQIAAYIFIMLFAYGGEKADEMGARGIFGAAATVVNVITYSSFLAYALYPKLLADKKSEDITTSLKMVLMFAFPLTAGALALSDSYITMLNAPANAAPVLAVLSIDSFVTVISGIFSAVLFGVETVDEEGKLSLRRLVKSRLFIAFSLPYFHSAITLPTTRYVLASFAQNQPIQAAFYVSIINTTARFMMFLVLYFIVRKMVTMRIPWKAIGKYIFAAAVMGTVLYVIPHPTRILLTLVETAAGGVIYVALLMVMDVETRKLPTTVWREIRKKKEKQTT